MADRQSALYVSRVYGLLLQRPPDPAECARWITTFEKPDKTRTAVALGVLRTAEFTRAQVDWTFRSYLRLMPAEHDRRSAVRGILAGGTYDALRARVFGSDAYWNSHGATAGAFINGLYHDVLGKARSPDVDELCGPQSPVAGQVAPRTPVPGELRHWTSQLGTHPSASARTRVARSILASPEAKERLVSEWYEWFLGRVPCRPERAHHVRSLLTGRASDQEVMASILAEA